MPNWRSFFTIDVFLFCICLYIRTTTSKRFNDLGDGDHLTVGFISIPAWCVRLHKRAIYNRAMMTGEQEEDDPLREADEAVPGPEAPAQRVAARRRHLHRGPQDGAVNAHSPLALTATAPGPQLTRGPAAVSRRQKRHDTFVAAIYFLTKCRTLSSQELTTIKKLDLRLEWCRVTGDKLIV